MATVVALLLTHSDETIIHFRQKSPEARDHDKPGQSGVVRDTQAWPTVSKELFNAKSMQKEESGL